MFELHRGARRGHSRLGWLDSRHSFTFGDHVDPENMSFGPLRVINEDCIVGGAGFGMHSHQDMEIISYVLSGALAHKDSIGNGSVIRSGEVQHMSAGTGVMHSEYNHSSDQGNHFLQIWIEPKVRGVPAAYQQRLFSPEEKRGRLRLILSPDGAGGSMKLNQDALVYAGLFHGSEAAAYSLPPGRKAYLHVARGALHVNGSLLRAGDAAKAEGEQTLELNRAQDAEVLLFDVAGII
jgi:redox-sensitive bicupin YhaK (pirin superfamily)